MAIFVFLTPLVLVGGTDLTDHASKATCVDDRNEVDVTAFGASFEQITKGLGKASITIDFFQDFAGSKTHQTLQPLISSSTPIAVEVRPVNAARSATNPAFLLAACLMFTYSGLDSAVGEAAAISAVFKNAPGGSGMTYPTA